MLGIKCRSFVSIALVVSPLSGRSYMSVGPQALMMRRSEAVFAFEYL